MANKENLRPQAHKLTVEEQSKGGKASGKSRRAKRTLSDAIRLAMSYGLTDDEKESLKAMQVADEDCTQVTLIAVALIKKAKDGDIKAIDYLRRTFTHNPLYDAINDGLSDYEEEL